MTEKTDKPKRRNRHRENSDVSPRVVMAFRVSKDLHEKIKTAALVRGYALSEEIEARLERSFDSEALEDTLRRVLREEAARG